MSQDFHSITFFWTLGFPGFIGFDEKIFASKTWKIVLRTLQAAEQGTYRMSDAEINSPIEALQLVMRYDQRD